MSQSQSEKKLLKELREERARHTRFQRNVRLALSRIERKLEIVQRQTEAIAWIAARRAKAKK